MSARRLGLLLDQTTSYGRGVAAGIRRQALPQSDLRLLVAEPSVTAVQRWSEDPPDAVIAHIADLDLLAALRRLGRPLVNVSNHFGREVDDLPRVRADDVAIGRMAAEHVIERRFSRAVYLGYAGRAYSDQRRDGFIARLAEAGIPVEEGPTPGAEGPGPEAAAWLAGRDLPLVAFVIGDEYAAAVMKACRGAGLGVPEPVAVLSGSSDPQICALAQPPLSAVHLDVEAIGVAAARLVCDLLAGAPAPAEPVLIRPSHVIERESTNIEAVTEPLVAKGLAFIRAHAHEGIGVEEVVAECGVSRRTLERRFAEALGESIYHRILAVRFRRAQILLRTGDATLEEIAREAGFADAQHLCRIFKEREGCTPGEYRSRR